MPQALPHADAATAHHSLEGVAPEQMPRHIAVIMDGNGRWAAAQGLARSHGHRQGALSVRRLLTEAAKLGIEYLTLYSFSIENWNRPREEIDQLMQLYVEYMASERATLVENNIRLKQIGRRTNLPPETLAELEKTIEATRACTGPTLVLAVNYSSRAEITDGVRDIAERVARGELDPADITEDTVSASLYTADIPDPDLLIRTSGEMRLSNYLLWQISYAELYITPTLWPEFAETDLHDAIRAYAARDRRYGRVTAPHPLPARTPEARTRMPKRHAANPAGHATLTPEQRASFEQALASLGLSVHRWKESTASIRREDGKLELDAALLLSQLPDSADTSDPRTLCVLIAPMLGLPLPHAVLTSLDEARPWLRPRLIHPRELTGPRRNMCRRDAFARLLRAISIGPGSTASLVRTEELDRWGIEFDQAFAIACTNLRSSLLPDDIHEVDESFGTLAIIHDSEPAAAACFIFDTLLPHWQPESGAVFAIPTEDTCLVMPIMHGMGAQALADFVQMTFNLFNRTEDPLCDQLIWATGRETGGRLDPTPHFRHLPITTVEERSGKRVHLEAEGAMGDLLRVLGALD